MPNFEKTGQIISLNQKRRQKHSMMKKGAPQQSQARVIAITSGKGGVGKTNIVANLGYALCKAGKRVLIFDADLGLGNLDVLLGLTPQVQSFPRSRRQEKIIGNHHQRTGEFEDTARFIGNSGTDQVDICSENRDI